MLTNVQNTQKTLTLDEIWKKIQNCKLMLIWEYQRVIKSMDCGSVNALNSNHSTFNWKQSFFFGKLLSSCWSTEQRKIAVLAALHSSTFCNGQNEVVA